MDEVPVGAGAPERPDGVGGRPDWGDALRVVAMAAAVGSAAIHVALAPAHLDERTADGVFFLVVAWAQVAAALALGRWRDRSWPWLAAAALNGGVALVWLGSRTVGVPESHHTSIGFPDALAAAFEVTVVLVAALRLRGGLAGRPAPALAVHPLLVGALGVALAGLVSASITPSMAGEAGGHGHGEAAAGDGHGHDGGGHGHDGAAAQQVAAEDRCDLGFNTEAFNAVAVPGMPHAHDDTQPVDFTLEEWAEVFVGPEAGVPVDVVLGYLEDNPAMAGGILSGGLTHTLDPDPWNALTDDAECEALADELLRAKDVAARHPTVADAEAAGYVEVTPYFPGIAAHYIRYDLLDGDFVLEEPEMLLYDGTEQGSHIVGLSYLIDRPGDTEPAEGFTGDNDHYHVHNGLCFADGVVVAGSNTTDAECAALGGEKLDGASGWMSHVWIVPGCESDWGLFSGANPALPVLGTGGWEESGCGTGRTLDDPLAFETGGDGPGELASG